MKISVEMSVEEKGVIKESRGYLRDSAIELEDLLKWTKERLIVIADQALEEEQAKGFDKEPILLIDGKKNRPITSVSPLGQIEFVARMDFGDILIEAYDGLLKRSKILTGRYIKSHYVFHNGVQVAVDAPSLTKWIESGPTFKNKDTIRIVNIQPYARRLELLGVTAQRTQNKRQDLGRSNKKKAGLIAKVPNGAYQLTVRAVKSKYKNNSSVRFTFLPGSSIGLSGVFKKGRKGKNSAGRPYLYPTIVFTVDERGIL